MADSYPNLERSLKEIVLGDYLFWIRRLDKWIWLIGIGFISMFIVDGQYWMAALAFAAMTGLEILTTGIRIKSFKLKDQVAESLKEDLPRRMKQDLKRGRLVSKLGEEAVGLLDQCAKSATEVTVNCVQARMLKSGASDAYIQAQDEASKVANALMRRAIVTVQRQLVYRVQTGEPEIKKLSRTLDDLRALESESRSLADRSEKSADSSELQSILAHVRALRDAIDEVEAQAEITKPP